MIPITEITGRLGNQMFQFARIYALSKKEGTDFYSQDERYFKDYEGEIKQLFGEGIGFIPFVGIHVRRGDYVDNPFYVDLTKTDYYEKAMAHFPDKNFLVFSDDTEFCKEYFKDKVQVVEGGTELEDFNQLASCEHIIIANSSFSWWAAYLCNNPSKVIIAPSVENWHPDGVERTKCPKEWLKI